MTLYEYAKSIRVRKSDRYLKEANTLVTFYIEIPSNKSTKLCKKGQFNAPRPLYLKVVRFIDGKLTIIDSEFGMYKDCDVIAPVYTEGEWGSRGVIIDPAKKKKEYTFEPCPENHPAYLEALDAYSKVNLPTIYPTFESYCSACLRKSWWPIYENE